MLQGITVYFVFTLLIIVTIFFKKKPILIAASGLIVVGIMETGSLFGGLQIAFRVLLFTATDLMPIILLIGLVVAMTDMLKTTGADKVITVPFLRIRRISAVYWIFGISLWILTLFLWPTPAVTLLGAVALPVMVNTGINPLGTAMGFCIFGGMGLAGDFIIQGAPGLLAKAAGIDVGQVVSASLPLVAGSGLVAAGFGYWKILRMGKKIVVSNEETINIDEIKVVEKTLLDTEPLQTKEAAVKEESVQIRENESKREGRGKSKLNEKDTRKFFLAILVSFSYALTILWLLRSGLRGDSAAAVTGGISITMLVSGTIIYNYRKALNNFVLHIQEGMKISMGVFAPIVVIAGFFLLGTQSGNEQVLNRIGPGYLEALAWQVSGLIYINEVTSALVVVLTAILGAMSGSGFSAIPLVGGVAAALGEAAGVPVVPLAVLGQAAAIWTDATVIPWGFPAVVGAVTRTEAMRISKQNILPWSGALISISLWTIISF